MNRAARPLALVIVSLAIAGCSQTAGPQPGLAAPPAGRVATGPAPALVGADLRAEQDAEMRALEFGRTGAPTAWRNPLSGHYGEITPGATYRVNTYECRDYTATVNLGGGPETTRSTACKQPDGTWRPVT